MEDKSVNSLPADVLLQIFSQIFETDIKETKNITNVMQVNKRWNTLSSNHQMWENILLNLGKKSPIESPTEREEAIKTALINFLNWVVYVRSFPRTVKKILQLFVNQIDQKNFRKILLDNTFSAIKANNLQLVQLLCEAKQGELKELFDETWHTSCVIEAIGSFYSKKKSKIIKYLIDLNKNILHFPNFEKTIAFFSLRRLHSESEAQFILENISPATLTSIDESGNTLLMYAICRYYKKVVEYLLNTLPLNKELETGFSLSKYIMKQSNSGFTALHHALKGDDSTFFTLLGYINPSLAITVQDSEGNTLLHSLFKSNTDAATLGISNLLNFLLNTMPPEILNARNIDGDTALHLAVRNHPFFVVNLIGYNKIDKLLYNKNGLRPDQLPLCDFLQNEVKSYKRIIPKSKKEISENILRQIDAIDPKSESVIADLTGMYNAVVKEQFVLCHEDGGMKMFSSQGKTNTWKSCVNALKAKAIEIAEKSKIVQDKMDEPEVRILFDSILELKTSRFVEADERSFKESFDNLREYKPK